LPDVGFKEWCAFPGDFLVPIFILMSAYDLYSSTEFESMLLLWPWTVIDWWLFFNVLLPPDLYTFLVSTNYGKDSIYRYVCCAIFPSRSCYTWGPVDLLNRLRLSSTPSCSM
jgi:hypothetical protein